MNLRPQHLWDRASVYLPVLLMGLLALGSWWLVRSAPSVVSTAPKETRGHEPDYFMQGFTVKNFGANGALLSEVSGETGRHFADTDTLEIDGMRLHSVDAAGRETKASAKRALSNADGSDVQLFGDARVVREAVPAAVGASARTAQPRLSFAGDFLHIWPQEERVESNQPVTLTRGNDTFEANELQYNNAHQVLELKGRVRGSLMPRKPD